MGVCMVDYSLPSFVMLQRMVFAIAVVALGLSGGIVALFVRGMHAEASATLDFCLVCALAIVQAWMVASGIAQARRLHGDLRNSCFRGAQAKCGGVLLVGVCAVVGVLPMALIGASSGAPARFATIMLGGAVFSTTAALTLVPVLIVRMGE
jgi:cobalt-zinc-cadmium resistance protein CzcA